MISPHDAQVAIVAKLNAVRVTFGLPVDVKEYNFQGTDYAYPSLRVRINSVTPDIVGPACDLVTLAFEVLAFSEAPSSSEASQIEKDVVRALRSTALTIDSTHQSTPLRVVGMVGPTPLSSQRGWMTDVHFECKVG